MTSRTTLFSMLLIGFAITSAKAQKNPADSTITGIWKGTSICQIKNSPCHDEIVVYHVSKAPAVDSFNILANKIVNGAEEEMGTIGCRLDRKSNQLISTASNAVWTFNLKGREIDGTLFYRGDLYRIIKVSKQP